MSFKPSLLHFKFANFADLPHDIDAEVPSERVTDSHGRPWRLRLRPADESGNETSNSNDPDVGVFLFNVGSTEVHARSTFIMQGEGQEYIHQLNTQQYGAKGKSGFGLPKWIKRSQVLNELDSEGALLIDVLIQVKPPSTSTYVPPNPAASNFLALFDGGIGSDVTFNVGDHLIRAHKAIIQVNSQILCDCLGSEETPVSIEGISEEAFAVFLRCFYGGGVSDALSVAVRKDIITAADRFEAPHIKIAAETSLVGEYLMDDDSVCDWYEFAHYKTCPLLKEQASAYFFLRAPALLRAAGSEKLKESPQLMAELMAEMSHQMNGTGDPTSVNELRKELAEQGLDVDGSKEILTSRLQSSKKRSREE